MKKLIRLLLALAIAVWVTPVLADELPRTFDTGYREQDANGNYYLTDTKEHVLTCSGYFLVQASHSNSVRCPNPAYKRWMTVFHRGTKFMDRIEKLREI